jgi:hypothetical protein
VARRYRAAPTPPTPTTPTNKTLASTTINAAASPQAAGTIRMHYHRAQGDEAQWGVYSWEGPTNPSPAWITGRFMLTQSDAFGRYVDIPVDTAKTAISFLLTDGSGNKNCGNDQSATFNANIATVGQHGLFGRQADRTHLATPVVDPLEESDADASAKQDGGAEDVQPFDEQVPAHAGTSVTSWPCSAAR